ncbi:MAG: efflux RND transporter periplasmic adaptor subunit, partial [Oscillospiraceae bacterium]|nr:efflux RND transporter periplasmic adaptor subunit [Oscillospiraceae bacterium]
AGSALRPKTLAVGTLTLQPRDVAQTVDCTGTVESAGGSDVYLDTACVIGNVYVQSGQHVDKGAPLFDVDIPATQQALASVGAGSVTLPADLQRTYTAPADGVVTSLSVRSGALSDTSSPCAVIAASDDLQVSIIIRERDLKQIQVGDSVRVSGMAFAKDSYTGTVTWISPTARQRISGTSSETVVDATVKLDGAEIDDSLRLGLTASAEVDVGTVAGALVVPYTSVLQDAVGEYVYVLAGGRAVRRDITTGLELPDGFCVTGGLNAGDEVLNDPAAVQYSGQPAKE